MPMPTTHPAVLGSGRLGNFRLGYMPAVTAAIRRTRVRILLAGLDVRVRVAGLSIRDLLNDAPNTASLTIAGSETPVGEQSLRITINSDTPRLLFAGALHAVDGSYEGRPTQKVHPCTAIDDTDRAKRRQPFGTWTNTSATVVAQYLATLAGMSAAGIQAGLLNVSVNLDGTEGFNGAMAQLATLIGGYWKVEDNVVYLFETDTTDAPDAIDSTPHRFLDDPPIRVRTDESQLRTRVFAKGHGELTLTAVAAGESIVPVSNAEVWFGTVAAGGKAISETQVLAYTSVQASGPGSLVGPGGSPSSPLVVTPSTGAGLGLGDYACAYTDVTAVGESLPSPLTHVTTTPAGTVADPTLAITAIDQSSDFPPNVNGGSAPNWNAVAVPHIGDSVEYAYSWSTAATPTDLTQDTARSPASTPVTVLADGWYATNYGWTCARIVSFLVPAPTDAHVTFTHVWRRRNAGSWLQLGTVALTPLNGFVVQDTSQDTATSLPASNAIYAAAQQLSVSAIAPGPAGTTGRNYYRTAVGGAQLKLAHAFANNTTTGPYIDTLADGSLGVNAPTSDTSGQSALASLRNPGGFSTIGVAFNTVGSATAANTASPVFTVGAYAFVAGDVGAVIYIQSGTNWLPGRYPIVSVAAGVATLAGPCATVASPTNATWGVDYSALPAPRFTYTDLLIDATTNTKVSSAAFPFALICLGNVLNVTGGPLMFTQRVVVLSISGAVVTCDAPLGTVSGTGGTGTLGGPPPPTRGEVGATSIALASPGRFASGGGWVRFADGQLVRFTGVSATALTGIPASGLGSIQTTVVYNSTAVPVPALAGVTGLIHPLVQGAPVNVWVERNDLPAQAAQAAIDAANGRLPADGIYEAPPIVDERRNEASLIALCDATLALFSRPLVTVTYDTRDVKSKSGKTVHIDLASPPIGPIDLAIQEVTITEIDTAAGTPPRFSVTASSVRFRLEDLLRRMAA